MLAAAVAVLLLAAVAGAAYGVHRARRARRTLARLRTHWARLVTHYAEAPPPAGAPVHTLSGAAEGTVAIAPDGLYFALIYEGTPVDRHVPWAAVQHLHAAGTDGVCVIVDRVGDLLLPARASHDVWHHANEAYRQTVQRAGGGHDRTAASAAR